MKEKRSYHISRHLSSRPVQSWKLTVTLIGQGYLSPPPRASALTTHHPLSNHLDLVLVAAMLKSTHALSKHWRVTFDLERASPEDPTLPFSCLCCFFAAFSCFDGGSLGFQHSSYRCILSPSSMLMLSLAAAGQWTEREDHRRSTMGLRASGIRDLHFIATQQPNSVGSRALFGVISRRSG